MSHDISNEIIQEIPQEIIMRYGADAPLLIAYGCILLEHYNGNSYAYRAINLKTGKSANLCRKVKPLTTSGVENMVKRIKLSHIAGAGRMEIDMPPGESVSVERLAEILDHFFWEILPEHGYGVRIKQMELATHILYSISRRAVSLSEAEVGTGKTIAYLCNAALMKRGRLIDFHMRGHYPKQSYAESAYLPVIISTSSIALQYAIIKDYIPELSCILKEHGIIKEPLSCVIRKGKEHYLCEKNLLTYFFDANDHTKSILAPLLESRSPIDLGVIDGLTPYIKRRISVSGRCDDNCSHRLGCRYLKHVKHVQSPMHDFQVCNHNYLLADVIRRSKGENSLIPHYQLVIIDESHKFLQAAQQMYSVQLSSTETLRIVDDICGFTFEKGESGKDIKKLAIKLDVQNRELFKLLNKRIPADILDDDTERFTVIMDDKVAQHLRNLRRIIDCLSEMLSKISLLKRYEGRRAQIMWELENIKARVSTLQKHEELVCWLEKPDDLIGETRLCGIPKNLNDLLYRDLWSSGVPIVLTSGTMSAAGDFERTKKSIGVDRLPRNRLMETSKQSPFNYHDNVLIYISAHTPFPDYQNREYIYAVADETIHLIKAAHGHSAVLFTSYKVMDMVYDILDKSGLSFPLFRLNRGGSTAIERFKQSGNGVLLASGALWEGIDLPGDILSMLIIVKLPFAVPDPISEYERTLYDSIGEYKNAVVVPEMLVKLKQGFGRLIRSETDTGVVAFLDCRTNEQGAYRDRVLSALPDCEVTADINDVQHFIRIKKGPDYFR